MAEVPKTPKGYAKVQQPAPKKDDADPAAAPKEISPAVKKRATPKNIPDDVKKPAAVKKISIVAKEVATVREVDNGHSIAATMPKDPESQYKAFERNPFVDILKGVGMVEVKIPIKGKIIKKIFVRISEKDDVYKPTCLDIVFTFFMYVMIACAAFAFGYLLSILTE